jgi:glycosyltransferase involved in cell wall biosynthesis
MNKIIYIANIRLPTEKAHGIQIMKTCEALARENVEITVLIPWRRNNLGEDPFKYYSTDKIFRIKKLFSLDTIFLGKIGFWMQSVTFSISIFFYILINIFRGEKFVYYSRDEIQLCFPILLSQKTVWESHRGNDNFLVRFIVTHCWRIIVISNGLKDLYRRMIHKEILVAPDGVDIEQFRIDLKRETLRKELDLPQDRHIVLYTGHLYDWKGAHILAESSLKLNKDALVVFIGGTDKDIVDFRERYSALSNIVILGRKLHQQIPLYLKASDILVIPNSAKEDISRLYTSPMKLFEYMASGTPIIASDIPSIREILNDTNAVFFRPDNADSLAESINQLLNDKDKKEQISLQAGRDIISFSWTERAKKIHRFVFSK